MSCTVQGSKVIVVGGGLAGLSAAHTVLERGGSVLLLDKKDYLGGNSVKATSGINGALTSTQIKLGIPDSAEIFERDTALSANKGKSADSHPLYHTLTHDSGPAVEWLMKRFKLDLSLVSRLGGHSQPRTHRGKERFPGMTITMGLMDKFDDLCKEMPTRAQTITNAKVTRLLTDANGQVNGVEYEREGVKYSEQGPVILASGGYGYDFSKEGLLAKYRPDLLHLPTTNGDHNTGDGIKLTSDAGGALMDMTAVQVHPTGLVHPLDPDSKVKFLAAEALRGVGGLLLDRDGKRFCNELGTRDYVTGEMWKNNKAPYRLLLNGKGSKEIEWHCKHYVGRGLMKSFKSGAELAKEMGLDAKVLAATFKSYNEAAAAGTDAWGKKYFQNLPFDMNDNYWHVAVITPVVHYTMGGVKINEHAEIIKEDGSVLKGLYAGGEIAGGVHGQNRLGGSGLLEAVVYGRVAGASASCYLLNQLSTSKAQARADKFASHLFSSFHLQSKPDGLVITLSHDDDSTAPSSSSSVSAQQHHTVAPAAKTAAAPAAEAKKAEVKELKTYTMEEVAKHNTESDCWVVVNGDVLNATSFLSKHPGGKLSILLYAGKEASEEFNMLHKPDVVMKFAPEIIIGKIGNAGGTPKH